MECCFTEKRPGRSWWLPSWPWASDVPFVTRKTTSLLKSIRRSVASRLREVICLLCSALVGHKEGVKKMEPASARLDIVTGQLWVWSNTAIGCPERVQSLCPWRYSEPDWTQPLD